MNFQELMQRMVDLDRPVTEEDKADKDYDGDGEVESGKDEYMGSRMKAAEKEKAVDEEFIDECGMDMPSGMMGMRNPGQQDSVNMNVSLNAAGSGGIKDLMDILRNIENSDDGMEDPEVIIKKMSHPGLGQNDDEGPGDPIIGQEELANAPDEMYAQHNFAAGGDLNRPKGAYPAAQPGDNAMAVETIKTGLAGLYEQIKNR
jgi:hypothetical protein